MINFKSLLITLTLSFQRLCFLDAIENGVASVQNGARVLFPSHLAIFYLGNCLPAGSHVSQHVVKKSVSVSLCFPLSQLLTTSHFNSAHHKWSHWRLGVASLRRFVSVSGSILRNFAVQCQSCSDRISAAARVFLTDLESLDKCGGGSRKQVATTTSFPAHSL